jgi:hypothetical protein
MDAYYIHEACHEAMLECPQFSGYDDDEYFSGYGVFGNIPKSGIYKTIMFWREFGFLLWENGYEETLPEDVRDLFDNIDIVIDSAIKNYIKTI